MIKHLFHEQEKLQKKVSDLKSASMLDLKPKATDTLEQALSLISVLLEYIHSQESRIQELERSVRNAQQG